MAQRPAFILTVIATATLIGTIIGVGIFSVPLVMSRIGLIPALMLAIGLILIMMIAHLLYAEVVIACRDRRRFPGLVGEYIGKNARHIASVTAFCQSWGAMTAYMLMGGLFLRTLLQGFAPLSLSQYQVTYAVTISALIFFGLRWISRLGLVTTIGLIILLLTICAAAAPHWVIPQALQAMTLTDIALAYGVLLFSFSGMPAIPDMEEVVHERKQAMRIAVGVGSLVACSLITLFGVIVWGASADGVTPDAISGLVGSVGPWVGVLGAAMGLFSVSTAFMNIATNAKEMFMFDFGIKKIIAWLATVSVPLVFVMVGVNVTGVISFSGALFGGTTSIMVCMLYLAIKKKKLLGKGSLRVPSVVVYAIMAVFAAGAIGNILLH